MRPDQRNPLDLNNLPEEYGREGKQVLEESSTIRSEASDTTRCRKKKNGGKDGKDECEKVYECRFCSLKFCKSQALGGHMNRHRQERETETLNRARQLVFSNENLAAQGGPPLGLRDPNLGGNMGDPSLSFRPVYPARLYSGSSSTILSPAAPPPVPPQPYLYTSSSRLVPLPSQYPVNDYFVGHVLTGNSHHNPNLNYTCIGAPMGHGFQPEDGDGSLRNQEDGLNWGRNYAGTQQRLDSSSINRFHDGFKD